MGLPKQYKIHNDPQVSVRSGKLFKAMLRKRKISVGELRRRICQTVDVSDFFLETWMGNKRASTIPPAYYPILATTLDLTDDELEELMMCSLQEWGPYWTDDGRDTPYDRTHTYSEIAEGWGCSRQNIQRMETRILAQLAQYFK